MIQFCCPRVFFLSYGSWKCFRKKYLWKLSKLLNFAIFKRFMLLKVAIREAAVSRPLYHAYTSRLFYSMIFFLLHLYTFSWFGSLCDMTAQNVTLDVWGYVQGNTALHIHSSLFVHTFSGSGKVQLQTWCNKSVQRRRFKMAIWGLMYLKNLFLVFKTNLVLHSLPTFRPVHVGQGSYHSEILLNSLTYFIIWF
jgi:hypothetical protein